MSGNTPDAPQCPDDAAAINAIRVLRAAITGERLPDITPQDAQGAIHAMAINSVTLLMAAFRAIGVSEDELRQVILTYLDGHHAALLLGDVSPVPDIRFELRRPGA